MNTTSKNGAEGLNHPEALPRGSVTLCCGEVRLCSHNNYENDDDNNNNNNNNDDGNIGNVLLRRGAVLFLFRGIVFLLFK